MQVLPSPYWHIDECFLDADSMGNARWSSPVQSDADQNPPFDESILHSNYELVRSSRPHITGYISPTDMSNSLPRNRELGSIPEVTPSRGLSKLQNSGRHVDTPPPKSTFLHGAMGERTLSPFLKPSPPTAAFGISPRSLRLRPLPRSPAAAADPPGRQHTGLNRDQ